MMEVTRAAEDYLKTIYRLGAEDQSVTNARLAQRLGVSAASVSGMVNRLEAAGFVARSPDGEITLEERGKAHALRVIRRHRLVETFLQRVLGVPWDEVHAEAEVLEHAISDRLEERIAEALGHPTHDPHGDPIPPRDGVHDEGWPRRLDDVREGDSFVVERVSDRDAEVLRHLASLGIRPGTVLHVEQRAPFEGPLWVRVGDRRHALGDLLTRSIFGSVPEGDGREQPSSDGVRS
jgi:DtxR family Mn-dependent transcriptional regulator